LTPQQIYIKQLEKAFANRAKGDDCMKGKIQYAADRCQWRVFWYDEIERKNRLISRYKGELMPCTAFQFHKGKPRLDSKNRLIPDKEKCQGYERAEKLLTLMRNRYEEAKAGLCKFSIEEFTEADYVDVANYYEEWINKAIEKFRKPATVKAYRSYHRTWIKPFFEKNNVRLHEIDLDVLTRLLEHILNGLEKPAKKTGDEKTRMILKIHADNPNAKSPQIATIIKDRYGIKISDRWIRRTIAQNEEKSKDSRPETSDRKNYGKTALNILSTLHTMMDYALRKGKIQKIPPFPKTEDYGIQAVEIKWLSRDEADAVFKNIPDEHLSIFLWLKYHFRRPGEACALQKVDYDPINEVFTIRRSISARVDVNSVKTNWQNPTIHITPCHPNYREWAKEACKKDPGSKYFFNNPRSRKKGRYTLEALRNIWYKACDDAGVERIWTYNGVKHTACTQFMEDGGTPAELQLLTGHKNAASIRRYADVTANRIKQVQAAAQERTRMMVEKEEKMKKEMENLSNQPNQDLSNVIFLRNKKE